MYAVLSLLQWETQETTKIDHEMAACGPIAHGDFLYQFYLTTGTPPALYRIKVCHQSSVEAWQAVVLPSGDWYNKCTYLFTYSGRLFCILQPANLSAAPFMFSFDESQHWKLFTRLPVPLMTYGIVVVDSTLYVLGGFISTAGVESPLLSTVHTCDLSAGAPLWDSVAVPDLPYGCKWPELVTLGSYIHVLGYDVDKDVNRKQVISMDMSLPLCHRHWSCQVLPPTPNNLCQPAVMNDFLVVLGGWNDLDQIDHMAYLYVPECHDYLDLPSFKFSKSLPPYLVCDNRLLIVDGTMAVVEYLSI